VVAVGGRHGDGAAEPEPSLDFRAELQGDVAHAHRGTLGEVGRDEARRLEEAREEDAQQILDDAPDDLPTGKLAADDVRELAVAPIAREDRSDDLVEPFDLIGAHGPRTVDARARSVHGSPRGMERAVPMTHYRPGAAPDYSHRFHAGNVGDVWK